MKTETAFAGCYARVALALGARGRVPRSVLRPITLSVLAPAFDQHRVVH